MQLSKFILHLCSLVASNIYHRSKSCPSSQGAWTKVWAQLCNTQPLPSCIPIRSDLKQKFRYGPEILLQFLVSKTSLKYNFWKPRMKRLRGILIFKVIQSTKYWAWLMFSHKYYGKPNFLFNEGWTNCPDCLTLFACCWMYFSYFSNLMVPGQPSL